MTSAQLISVLVAGTAILAVVAAVLNAVRHRALVRRVRGPGDSVRPGLVTFLRTDIEGSSHLWQMQSRSMASAIDVHDSVLACAIRRNGGAAERNEGDSFFAIFARPSQAMAAAFEIQRELETQPWLGTIRLRVRIGIHTGEAGRMSASGRVDARGLEANICGRVSDLAKGGQVLLTLQTAVFVKRALPKGAVLRDCGWHLLRDVAEPHRLYELVSGGVARGSSVRRRSGGVGVCRWGVRLRGRPGPAITQEAADPDAPMAAGSARSATGLTDRGRPREAGGLVYGPVG